MCPFNFVFILLVVYIRLFCLMVCHNISGTNVASSFELIYITSVLKREHSISVTLPYPLTVGTLYRTAAVIQVILQKISTFQFCRLLKTLQLSVKSDDPIRDDTHTTSMKIFPFSRPPTSLSSYDQNSSTLSPLISKSVFTRRIRSLLKS